MAETWDETKPAGSRSPTLGDDDIREFKRSVRERMAEDHYAQATENPAFGAAGGYSIGKHKYLTLKQYDTAKTTESDEIAFRCKDVSGSKEVIITPPSAGTDRQLTKNGGKNLNILTSDMADGFIITSLLADQGVTTPKIADGAVDTTKIAAGGVGPSNIANYAVGTSQLDTSAVTGDKFADGSITLVKLENWDTLGNNNYYSGGSLGGDLITIAQETWTTKVTIKFFANCQIRFYWGYRHVTDSHWMYARLRKNGVNIASVSDQGAGGSNPINWRTDDVTLEPGDVIDFQGYVDDDNYPAELYIYLRGENKSAPHQTGSWNPS